MKLPDSWEPVKYAVKADQDQDAGQGDKGKEPARPMVSQWMLERSSSCDRLVTRDVLRAKAPKRYQKIQREIKQYEEKLEQRKKQEAELEEQKEDF